MLVWTLPPLRQGRLERSSQRGWGAWESGGRIPGEWLFPAQTQTVIILIVTWPHVRPGHTPTQHGVVVNSGHPAVRVEPHCGPSLRRDCCAQFRVCPSRRTQDPAVRSGPQAAPPPSVCVNPTVWRPRGIASAPALSFISSSVGGISTVTGTAHTLPSATWHAGRRQDPSAAAPRPPVAPRPLSCRYGTRHAL